MKKRMGKANSFYAKTGKPIFDLSLALLLLFFLLPLIIIIILLILFDSPGPILFSQRRIGYKNQLFTIYKFRTMYTDANKYEASPDSTEDQRLTKFGKYLRKTGLDEIPQLINILKGDMSLVGPRPEMPFLAKCFSHQELGRHEVKPGITGPWQISSYRKKPIHEGIKLDLEYVENVCFKLDFVLITKTIQTIFGNNTY